MKQIDAATFHFYWRQKNSVWCASDHLSSRKALGEKLQGPGPESTEGGKEGRLNGCYASMIFWVHCGTVLKNFARIANAWTYNKGVSKLDHSYFGMFCKKIQTT